MKKAQTLSKDNQMINKDPIIGVFISIPNCDSNSIREMFELGKNHNDHNDYNNHNNHNNNNGKSIIDENHQRLEILENKYDLKNKYIFTFVRHPYERIKSWFYYHKNIEPYKSHSLNEWISLGCQTHWKRQNQTNWAEEKLSPLLQYNFIHGESNINYIGKIENYEHDCKTIISQLNILFDQNNCQKKIVYSNIKKNSPRSKSNNDLITPENKRLIYRKFRKDFYYFNYKK